jgi:hypothetical protein
LNKSTNRPVWPFSGNPEHDPGELGGRVLLELVDHEITAVGAFVSFS